LLNGGVQAAGRREWKCIDASLEHGALTGFVWHDWLNQGAGAASSSHELLACHSDCDTTWRYNVDIVGVACEIGATRVEAEAERFLHFPCGDHFAGNGVSRKSLDLQAKPFPHLPGVVPRLVLPGLVQQGCVMATVSHNFRVRLPSSGISPTRSTRP
jgi:hypothetical protein